MAALASALLLPGCSQPVEVGGKSPAGAPADQPEPGAPAQAPAGEEIAPPEPDQTPPPASNEEPRREPPPTDSPDQPVAAADNLDAFFGAKDEPDEDDRYSAATPPAMAKPGEEPTLWKPQDGAAADEPQGVSDFFGDIMEPADEAAADPNPSSADSASSSRAETEEPLAGIPGAGDSPADTEELDGNQESLDDFFGVEPAAPAEQPPAAEESLDALPEIELPIPTDTDPPTVDEAGVDPLAGLPMAEPEPKPEVRPEADSPVPTVSPLPDWTPERPTAPAPEETLPQEPPAPSPEPEPPTATTSPFELPPPQLAAPPDPAPEPSQPAATPGLPTDLLRPAPKRPTFDATNTRLLAWQLGSKLGLLTADASPPAWETDALAETLGIQAVELDASGDPSKATSRLLKSAGVLGERLARRHGADHAALLEIAVKSNALVALLGQHPKLAGPVASAIEQAAGRSGLDSQLVTPFVEVLRSDPTPEQAREAVFNLHEAVAKALEAGQ